MTQKRRQDTEIRDRLIVVEERTKSTDDTLTEIKTMLVEHIKHDIPFRDAILLNTEHRKNAKSMMIGIWTFIVGIITKLIFSHFKG